MNLAAQMLRVHVPAFVRRRALRELFQATADAFGVSMPDLDGASADDLLERYAAFTAKQAATTRQSWHDSAEVRTRLYSSAYVIGSRLRRELGIDSTADAMAAARAVYGMLRIDFQPTPEGEVRIPQCFFSRFYSAPICRLMSSLDQGLLAGLSGGGLLEFRRRITEGAPCCIATFAEPPS